MNLYSTNTRRVLILGRNSSAMKHGICGVMEFRILKQKFRTMNETGNSGFQNSAIAFEILRQVPDIIFMNFNKETGPKSFSARLIMK